MTPAMSIALLTALFPDVRSAPLAPDLVLHRRVHQVHYLTTTASPADLTRAMARSWRTAGLLTFEEVVGREWIVSAFGTTDRRQLLLVAWSERGRTHGFHVARDLAPPIQPELPESTAVSSSGPPRPRGAR